MKKSIFILLSCIAIHSFAMDDSNSSEGGAVSALKKTRKKKEKDTTTPDANQYSISTVGRYDGIIRFLGAALQFDHDGCDTPLHRAVKEEDLRVALCECDIDARDAVGDTPLHKAVQRGQDEKALWLLGKGASCTVPNRHGKLPLHYITHATPEDLRIALIAETTTTTKT